jgi:Zn-dependent oligopeptidase
VLTQLHLPTLAARFGRIPLAMVSTVTLMENPLLQPEKLPQFSSIEPADLTPAVSELLTKMEQDFENIESKLENTNSPDYDQGLPEVERIQFRLSFV